jgi:hypothetical protein
MAANKNLRLLEKSLSKVIRHYQEQLEQSKKMYDDACDELGTAEKEIEAIDKLLIKSEKMILLQARTLKAIKAICEIKP